MKKIEQSDQETIRPSSNEQATRKRLLDMFEQTPIPREQILENLELYMRPQRISEILALQKLYMKIIDVHGIIVEFGVRWGRHLSVFSALRAIHEPYNFYRKIVGFDTFQGFIELSPEDGKSDKVHLGSMSVSEGYECYLDSILVLHEAEAPLAHIRRIELYKGDAPVKLAEYLERHPETTIAMAYFDMNLYKPTKECLELIKSFSTKGSIWAFDELMHPEFAGEVLALKEVLDTTQYKIRRFPTIPYPQYIVL